MEKQGHSLKYHGHSMEKWKVRKPAGYAQMRQPQYPGKAVKEITLWVSWQKA